MNNQLAETLKETIRALASCAFQADAGFEPAPGLVDLCIEMATPDSPIGRARDVLNNHYATESNLATLIRKVIAAEKSEGRANAGGFVYQPATREHQQRVGQAWRDLYDVLETIPE